MRCASVSSLQTDGNPGGEKGPTAEARAVPQPELGRQRISAALSRFVERYHSCVDFSAAVNAGVSPWFTVFLLEFAVEKG